MRLIATTAGPAYQAARWIKNFHESDYSHIGLLDHNETTSVPELLAKYGFIRVPRFELNAVRMLLRTYGPILIRGTFSQVALNQSELALPDLKLTRVTRYEDGGHALVVNGYWDGPLARVLYRDPAHPFQQFVGDLATIHARVDVSAPTFYLNCIAFPKPCLHVTKAMLDEPK